MLATSWALIWGHRRSKKNFRSLRQKAIAPPSSSVSPDPSEALEFRETATLQQKLTLNIFVRRLLIIGLILVWFGGMSTVLYTFPETRSEGRIVLRIPIRACVIWFVLLSLGNSLILYANYRLREWVEEGAVFSEVAYRRTLRAPTLLEVSRGIVSFASICVGSVWFIVWSGFPLAPILTGAGLLGATLTFIFQNLLKDWVNGFLIIVEDQYTVGDMIQFEGAIGIVEKMSLRATRLRGLDGRSSTVPHNQIVTAHNLSRDWSRVHFLVQVAYRTDPDVAIAVMKETALAMSEDPVWKKDIIDPVQVIGVNRLDYSGIEIMQLIVVPRLRQWDVDREYRRRLKLAFDARGIQIGIPQQSLFLGSCIKELWGS
jgi:small conductance mechanosensitive channel